MCCPALYVPRVCVAKTDHKNLFRAKTLSAISKANMMKLLGKGGGGESKVAGQRNAIAKDQAKLILTHTARVHTHTVQSWALEVFLNFSNNKK